MHAAREGAAHCKLSKFLAFIQFYPSAKVDNNPPKVSHWDSSLEKFETNRGYMEWWSLVYPYNWWTSTRTRWLHHPPQGIQKCNLLADPPDLSFSKDTEINILRRARTYHHANTDTFTGWKFHYYRSIYPPKRANIPSTDNNLETLVGRGPRTHIYKFSYTVTWYLRLYDYTLQ